MERLLARSLTTIIVVLAVLALVAAVNANTTHMAQLPSSAKLGCANCHVNGTSSQAPSVELNGFGRDFKNNGMVWNSTLAAMDSDGDRCLNGIELGDADGNGIPDAGQSVQTSNPGIADCQPSTLDETTWGALKSLFNSSK
ncbi:MAG: hypothetical protein ACYDIE_02065 [Candidatus Krumholzibacteriia bacterium]